MSTTCATATETQESRSQFLVRTTQFLKKVSNFRTASRKPDTFSRPSDVATYERSARSMDLGSKTLTKVDVRPHHSFDQSRDSGEQSPSHLSLRGSLQPNRASSSTTDSPLGPPLPRIDGLPNTTNPFPATTATSTNIAPPPATGHVRAQTLPPHNPAIPARSGHAYSHSTAGVSVRRALAPRLATLPPPLMAQYTAGGSARLTPSLFTRPPPMPIMNLPTLPPPTPSEAVRSPRPRAPLRSLPALPRQGPGEAEQDADHENASLDEEEDEEEGDDQSGGVEAEEDGDSDDSSNEDDTSPQPEGSSTAGPSRLSPLPRVDTSSFTVSFGGAGSQRTPHASPNVGSSVDYFTSKPPDIETRDRTPLPSDFRPNGKARATPSARVVPQPRIAPLAMPPPMTPLSPLLTPRSSSRPNLRHHASKSMTDLVSRKDKGKVYSPTLGRAPPKTSQGLVSPPAAGPSSPVAHKDQEDARPAPPMEPPDDNVIISPMLRRRRSLPVYEPSSDPPPYPDPLFERPRVQTQAHPPQAQTQASLPPPFSLLDEEGDERLPKYANSIYLTGVMPRKMEFSSPGVQAKDRKWRKVYCVLEGTAFRVYKCPPAASRVGAIERWWESKVGAGDFTSSDVTAMTATGIRVRASAGRDRDSDSARERGRRQEGDSAAAGTGTAAAGTQRVPKTAEEPSTPVQSPPRLQPVRERERERQTARERERNLPPTPPPSKSVLGLTSRFLRRSQSKGNTRKGSGAANGAAGPSPRLSVDSIRASETARHPSHATARHSMDTLGSISSTSNTHPTHATASTGLTVPSSASGLSQSSQLTEGASRRRSFLPHSNSSHNGGTSELKSADKDKDKAKGKDKDKDGYMPSAGDLLQQYTLQYAESGLASDYQKRKNVIRMRMAGEQFLLQAKDVAAVIDWIEGIQMGTNVALDLDERPMPRGPIFPRRRRRRARRAGANAPNGNGTISSNAAAVAAAVAAATS